MAKNVFRPNEITVKDGEKITLKLIHDYTPPKSEEDEKIEEYTGPSIDDLRKEAEAFKVGWEIEKKRMLDEAQKSADEIVKNAENAAFQEVKRQSDQAQVIKTDAQTQADEIIAKANAEAQNIIEKAKIDAETTRKELEKNAEDSGREEGFSEGKAEVDRLVEQIHKIIESVMQRREEILRDTEQQIVDIVILMTRKVVKTLSENQKDMILNNVVAALNKVKSRCNVTIRVNTEDVQLTTEHTDDFIKNIENVEGVTVVEDTGVDKGGCIVETDFGAIDARIASQLGELESKILEISPEKEIAL